MMLVSDPAPLRSPRYIALTHAPTITLGLVYARCLGSIKIIFYLFRSLVSLPVCPARFVTWPGTCRGWIWFTATKELFLSCTPTSAKAELSHLVHILLHWKTNKKLAGKSTQLNQMVHMVHSGTGCVHKIACNLQPNEPIEPNELAWLYEPSDLNDPLAGEYRWAPLLHWAVAEANPTKP